MADDSLFILEVNGQDRIKIPKIYNSSLASILTFYDSNFWVYRSEPLPFEGHESSPFSLYLSYARWWTVTNGNIYYMWVTLSDVIPRNVLAGYTSLPLTPRHDSPTSFGYSFALGNVGATLPPTFDLYSWLLGSEKVYRLQDGKIEATFTSADYKVLPNYDTSVKNKTITIT